MKSPVAALSVVVVLALSSMASAQAVVYESLSPVVTTAPVVVQSPVVVDAWRPVITNYRYSPPVSSPGFTDYTSNYGNYGAAISYYAPATTAYAPVTAYSPVVTSYSPVVTTTYSPVVTSAYRPVVSYYSPMYVRPRYYVPGQPVRNFFRGW